MLITRCWPLAGCLLLATACESRRPATEPPAAPAKAPVAAIAAGSGARVTDSAALTTKSSAPEPAAAAPTEPLVQAYRRYVGTVGTAPVVLELAVADSVRGLYYYQRRGGPLTLAAGRPAAGQPLTFRETDAGRLSGRWQTRQPLGPTLSGTWHSPDGRRQLPFALREDYAGAVRYVINTYSRQLKSTGCAPGDEQEQVSEAQWDEVRLLPPVSAALGRVQRHFNQLEHMAEGCIDSQESVEVTYNADFLLSVEQFHHEFAYGTPHPTGYYDHVTFDLRTGRTLALVELLRPDFELPLRRLLSARLRADPGYADFYRDEIEGDSTQTRWPLGPDGQPLAPLPRNGYYLTPAGLGFHYDMYEIAPYVMGPQLVELSYRDIRPLVRPGAALARLLLRRGL